MSRRQSTYEKGVDSPDEYLSRAVRRLAEQFHPLRIILFGSRARGESRPDSDIDLLVVLSDVPDKRAATIEMLDALSDRKVPVDIIVTDSTEISRRGNLAGTALRPALREGTVLYEQP